MSTSGRDRVGDCRSAPVAQAMRIATDAMRETAYAEAAPPRSRSPVMPSPADPAAAPAPRARRRRLLWALLVVLLLVAQSLLVVLTLEYEANRAQDDVEAVAVDVAAELRRRTQRAVQSMQNLAWLEQRDALPAQAAEWLRSHREWVRIEERDTSWRVLQAVDSTYGPGWFERLPRGEVSQEAQLACVVAQREAAPRF